MKTASLLNLFLVASFAPLAHAADSKRTAEYIIANSAEYEGKEVTLDVAFVKPVQWKSPVEDLAFFHAGTIDRRDFKRGGHILIAIPAENAASFSRKYGMDFEGRNDSDILRGTLLAGPGHRGRGRVWFIDTSGRAAELIKAKKIELQDDGGIEAGDRPRRRGFGGPDGQEAQSPSGPR